MRNGCSHTCRRGAVSAECSREDGAAGPPSLALSLPPAGRPPRSARVMPQAPRQPLCAPRLQNLSAEECAAPSAAGARCRCLRPAQDTPPASSSPRLAPGLRGRSIPREPLGAGTGSALGGSGWATGTACCEPTRG